MIFDQKILLDDAINAPDKLSFQEYVDYERHQHNIAHSKQNMEERKSYASSIFKFTCLWCVGLFIILIGCGLGILNLSTIAITTLIGTTTINIIIFFKLVTEYLFNKNNPHC